MQNPTSERAMGRSPFCDLHSALCTSSRRPAFTIVELIVSIGLLGIMMSIAGAVFSLTLRSSGEATALIEVGANFRMLEKTLREDLRNVPRGGSVLLLEGNAILAARTSDDAEVSRFSFAAAGSRRDVEREIILKNGAAESDPLIAPPRADRLLLVTSRPETSYADPTVAGSMQVVVYGHAELGTISASGLFSSTDVPFDTARYAPGMLIANGMSPSGDMIYGATDPVAGSGLPPSGPDVPSGRRPPAHDWILARRSTLIVNQPQSSLTDAPADLYDLDEAAPATGWIEDGRRDAVISQPESFANTPNAKGFFQGFKFRRDIVDRLVGWPYGASGVPQPSRYDNYDMILDAAKLQALPAPRPLPLSSWMIRSQIDPQPRATEKGRLGHLLLKNCASFQVEWALDIREVPLPSGGFVNPSACDTYPTQDAGIREVFWVDPGRFAGQIAALDVRQQAAGMLPECAEQLEAIKTVLVPRDPTDPSVFPRRFADFDGSLTGPWPTLRGHVFYSTNPTPVVGPDPYFPKYLRITVDLFDSANRLSRPVRHIMVLPVGQG